MALSLCLMHRHSTLHTCKRHCRLERGADQPPRNGPRTSRIRQEEEKLASVRSSWRRERQVELERHTSPSRLRNTSAARAVPLGRRSPDVCSWSGLGLRTTCQTCAHKTQSAAGRSHEDSRHHNSHEQTRGVRSKLEPPLPPGDLFCSGVAQGSLLERLAREVAADSTMVRPGERLCHADVE